MRVVGVLYSCIMKDFAPTVLLDLPGIIAIVAVVVIAILGVLTILYFTLFRHFRAKKQVRELVRRFEYLHALVFGQDAQFVKRLEIIARTNLLYVDIHMTFARRYREIKDKDDASMTASINRIKDIVSDRKWKDLKSYYPEVKTQIAEYDARVNALNNDLMNVIKPEEECRQASLAFKEKLRKLKQDYYVKQADLTLMTESFNSLFAKIEQLFNKFEAYVESAQYEDANDLLPTIQTVIEQLAKVFPDLPNICTTIQTVIPDKLASLKNRYEEMMRSGYPLHHLITNDDFEEIKARLADITKRLQAFDLRNVQAELDGILAEIDDYFEGFNKEKEAKRIFDEECESIYRSESQIEKKYIKLCNSLPSVKRIFVITGDEQARIDGIKNQINKAGATKRSLDTLIHSGTRQPFTLLVERMHQLRDEAEKTHQSIDDFEHYLLSLKSDSEAALKTIRDFYAELRQAEILVRQIDLESVNNRYGPMIDSLYETVDRAYKILSHTPIDLTALSLQVAELKGSGEETIRSIRHDQQEMMLAEAAIVFANRDRNHFGEVNTLLLQTEGLYFSGDFARSYEETLQELKRRHAGE